MTDYLTQLPAELLFEITRIVYASPWHTYLGSVSKAFLPIARDLAFSNIRIRSRRRFDQLCEAIRLCPGARPYVRALSVYLEPPMLTLETADLLAEESQRFDDLIERTPNLRQVTVDEQEEFPCVLLCPRGTPAAPRLERITLHDIDAEWSEVLSVRALRSYSKLEELRLDISDKDNWTRRLSRRRIRHDLPSITSLHLTGPVGDNAVVLALLGATSEVTSLWLHDRRDASVPVAHLGPLLSSLSSPASVNLLSIADLRPSLTPSIETRISALINLEKLEFRRGTWSSSLLADLHSLEHLTELYFHTDLGVSTVDLLALVEGPQRIKNLELLVVTRLETAPRAWSPTFTLDGMVQLVEAADRRGMRVSGTTVRRARVEMARREEEARPRWR
ncbi:hypothetical protein JCM10449v2_007851 [Rhodotorula kratochvilovae]